MTAIVGRMRRVLIVEFARDDPEYRATSLPFLFGFLRDRGMAATWLRYGVDAAQVPCGDTLTIALPDRDAEDLEERLRTSEPEVLVFNEQVEPALSARIHRVAPRTRTAWMAGGLEEATRPQSYESIDPQTEVLGRGTNDWARLLGLAEDPVSISNPTPDFGFEAANETAQSAARVFLLMGEHCTYRRPVKDNPHFKDLDLERCVHVKGCGFCGLCARPIVPWKVRTLDEAQMTRHIQRLADTYPGRGAERLQVQLTGDAALFHVDVIARAVVDASLGPADLILDARPDHILAAAARLRKAAEILTDAPALLHVALVGSENFSRPELERLNKGITPEENIESIRTLLELERDLPGGFSFRRLGVLSFILYTPWTRLEDLAFNLRVAQAVRLDHLRGNLFSGSLRLEQDLPVTRLAVHDLLIPDGEVDDDGTTPWRSSDPLVEALRNLPFHLQSIEDWTSLRSISDGDTRGLDVEPGGAASVDCWLNLVELLMSKRDRPGLDLEEEIEEAMAMSAPDPAGAWSHLEARLAAPGTLSSPWGQAATGAHSSLWLLFLREGEAVELVPLDPVGGSFRFRLGIRTWAEPPVGAAVLGEADRVTLAEERLELHCGDRLVADLSGRCFIWWSEGPLQADFWIRVLKLRAVIRDLFEAGAGPVGDRTAFGKVVRGDEERPAVRPHRPLDARQSPGQARVRRILHNLVTDIATTVGLVEGYRLSLLPSQHEDHVTLALDSEADHFTLLVEEARAESRWWFRLGPLAFSHPSAVDMDTDLRRAAVHGLKEACEPLLTTEDAPPQEEQ